MPAWSFSAIKTFEQCPKKYYHLKIAEDYKDEGHTASIYGNAAHEAAEHYIKHGTAIPDKYAVMRPSVEALAKIPGDKYAELRVGVRKTEDGFEPCGFFDDDAWYRGIIDLLVVNGSNAHIVDYKTGKNARYADMRQLDLMAGAVFTHFPEVTYIKSGLLFVVSKEFPRKEHTRDKLEQYLSVFRTQLQELEDAKQHMMFNPKSTPLCGWCPVTECPHWKER